MKLASNHRRRSRLWVATLLVLILGCAQSLRATEIADWQFNGNLNDSINGYDGTFYGGTATYTTITTGDTTSEALVLNGSDYMKVAVPSASLLNLNDTSFTLATWLYVEPVSTQQREAIIVGREPPGNLGNIALTADYQNQTSSSAAGPTVYGYTSKVGGGATSVAKSADLPYGSYENVVLSFNQPTDTLTLYINGIQESQVTNAAGPLTEADGTDPYYFGYGPGSNAYLDGDLDEVQIYNNSMTSAQITALYNDGNGPESVPEPSSRALLLAGTLMIGLGGWRRARAAQLSSGQI